MFKSGDKVRCIDADGAHSGLLVQGQEYVVDRISSSSGSVCVKGCDLFWLPSRFELLPFTPPAPAKQSPRECPCGIYRQDCTYHKE